MLLSYYIQCCMLVFQKDSFHKGVDQGPSFERLKMDIEHLDLGKTVASEPRS